MKSHKKIEQENKDTKIYSAIEELVKLSKYYKKKKKFKYIKVPFKLYDDVIHQKLFLCIAGIDSLYTKTELEQLYESVFSMNIKKNEFIEVLLDKFESRSFMLFKDFFNDSSSKLNIIKELKQEVEKTEKPVSELVFEKFQKFEDTERLQEDHRIYLCQELTKRDRKFGMYKKIYAEIDKMIEGKKQLLSKETNLEIIMNIVDKHLEERDNAYLVELFEKKCKSDYDLFIDKFKSSYYMYKKRTTREYIDLKS